MKKTDVQKGLGCLFLFALPFAGFGAFAAYCVTSDLWQWSEMRSWVEVPAEILEVELETHHDSESTTYEVKAEYRYSYEGVEYRSTRVAIHEGSDNISDFHEETYRELAAVKGAGRRYRCYLDPDAPSSAVLHRDLRWGRIGFYSIFVIAFGGVGVGLMAGGIYGSRRLARESALREARPREPWLHKDEWREGKIPSLARATLVTSAVLAVLWNTISAPLLFLVPRELGRGNLAALLGLLFPAVGVGLLVWVGRNLIRLWNFGESVLELSSVPGVIGGRLEGVVRARKELARARAIEVRLSAVGRARTGSGDDSRTEESILWQKTNVVTPHRRFGMGDTPIPVSFDIPADLPSSDDSDPDNQILWRLDVSAEVPGVDYEARFEVPVFRTGAPAPPRSSPAVETAGFDLDARLGRAGVQVEPLAGGKRFVFPRSRNTGSAIGFTVFFLVWSGIAVLLFHSSAPRIFPWVTSAFGVLFFFFLLDLWLYSSVVEVRPGRLSLRRGLLGGGRVRHWTTSEVESISARRGEQSGNRLFYKVEVARRQRRSKTVAQRIPDLDTAEALARELERTLRS